MDQFLLHVLRGFDLPLEPGPEWSIVPITKTQGYSNTRIYRVSATNNDAVRSSHLDPVAAVDSKASGKSVGPAHVWCLRSWPLAEPGANQLRWINQQLLVATHSCPFILAPIPSRRSAHAFFELAGRYWQIEPWATGRNDFHVTPTRERLASVMDGLSRLHSCWRSEHSSSLTQIPSHGLEVAPIGSVASSNGLRNRLAQLEQWRSDARELFARAKYCLQHREESMFESVTDWRQWINEVEQYWAEEFDQCFRRLRHWETVSMRLGPVLADIWSDHLFFENETLSAIIDYGAMRVDSVAADLSRCLSSLCGADAAARQFAIMRYESSRTLSEIEKSAIEMFDESSQLLGPFHWLRWLFIEERMAPSELLLRRLQNLLRGHPF